MGSIRCRRGVFDTAVQRRCSQKAKGIPLLSASHIFHKASAPSCTKKRYATCKEEQGEGKTIKRKGNQGVQKVSKTVSEQSRKSIKKDYFAEKRKAYTTTTERKSFGELFWPQRKTFQAGGRYKNPIKTRKTIPPPKSFLCAPNFFGKEKLVTSAPRMTGRRSHWTERGDDNIFLRFAIVERLFLLWLRMGLLSWGPSCVNSLYPSAEESWEEMTKIEPSNKMLYSPGSDQ